MRPMVGCALLLTALSSAACMTRKSVTLDELKILTPERAWVTWSDQSVVMMWEPKVVRDSLTGYIGRHREKLPTAGVTNVSVQAAARTRTALLVAGIAVGMTGFFVLAPPVTAT